MNDQMAGVGEGGIDHERSSSLRTMGTFKIMFY